MSGPPDSGLALRDAEAGDARLLFDWANEPETRRMSLNTAPIAWEAHRAWFAARLASAATRIYIATTPDGAPVGQIRFDAIDDTNARVSVSLAPAARGRGWGSAIIALGVRRHAAHSRAARIHAIIRTENVASRRAFEKAGFAWRETQIVDGQTCFHLECACA